MTICIAGKNRIAIDAMRYLITHFSRYSFVACVNKNDDGENGWQASYLLFCQENNIPVLALKDLYEKEDLLFVSLEYDRIIKPAKFKTRRLFNIHFSKLPAYKGMFTSIMPLLAGEIESGVTLHCIDEGIDTGAIIDQITIPLTLETTSRDLYELYLDGSITLFKKNINGLVSNSFVSAPQSRVNSSYYSKSALNFTSVTLDLNKTAFEIHNQIRAFTFREYQLPTVFDVPIYKSLILSDASQGKSGTIFKQDESCITLNTIDYQVNLFRDRQAEIIRAAETGDVHMFSKIEETAYPVGVRTKQGWDALIIACYHNQGAFVSFLLEKGWFADSSNYKGTTALMYAMTAASKEGNMSALKAIVNKADRSRRDMYGKDVYWYSEKYGNTTVIDFLKNFRK